MCTDLESDPKKILSWFVMRWQLEVTFQEMRRHLGFETQRQWSDSAIRRATPALLDHKAHPTFADALALVRKELWAQERQTFTVSPWETDTVKVPRAFVERLTDAVCYAA